MSLKRVLIVDDAMELGRLYQEALRTVYPGVPVTFVPSAEEARKRAAEAVAKISPSLRELEVAEPRAVIHSRELRMLIEQTRRNLLA